ncbi:MAG: flagellar type III secretion system pore protein FliP, partial [Mariprofundales bacterium]|nr:flagellar type III secretion system pore protein FliP [Mariprofundales bacterium]
MIWRTLALLLAASLLPDLANAADLPSVSLSLGQSGDPDAWFNGLKIVAMLTILTLSPSILIMMTSFTRILIVLGFLRQALGTQQSPPAQVLVGLSLFMTFFIMMPVWNQIDKTALTPYLNHDISQADAFKKAEAPLRKFMLRQTREEDLLLFLHAAKIKKPVAASETPFYVVVPSFVISELRTAFEIGFLIYIPFIVLDMVVASVLMSMGMMMLPPVMISLPFKIILFVLIDGW